jgi:hypothetical protein
VTADLTALLDEINRQLLDLRAAADGLATKAGILFAASGIAAAVLAPTAHPGHHQPLLIGALATLVASLIAGVIALMPWIQLGGSKWLITAMNAPTPRTTAFLDDSKALVLDANYTRLRTMRAAFTAQAVTALVAAGLALSYAARK